MTNDRTSVSSESVTQLSSDALARRRLLLKSLGKGSTFVGVSVIPMHTLANFGSVAVTTTGKRCNVSGMHSGVFSGPGERLVCMGYHPRKYSNRSAWPNGTNPDAFCTSVCPGSLLKTYVKKKDGARSATNPGGNVDIVPSTLFDVMSLHTGSDEYHWIGAWLNAMGGANNFPYTGAEVKSLFKNNSKRVDALKFFKDHMESLG